MTLPARIALVGFMGAGKSTVGRLLAARAGYRFADSDTDIETLAGAPITEIFRREGEDWFRVLEERAILALLEEDRIVIATGGGAFTRPTLASALIEGAFVVHLHCEFDEAYRRALAQGVRPLLGSGQSEAHALFAERKDKYSRAHVTVDATRRSPADVVEDILPLLASSSLVH